MSDGDHAIMDRVRRFLMGADYFNQTKLLETNIIQHPRPN